MRGMFDGLAPVAGVIPKSRYERFLRGYLDLLWLDVVLTERLRAYPGVPATNRFSTTSYNWHPYVVDISLLRRAQTLAEKTDEAERTDADRAVLAYTTAVLAEWPAIAALAAYYQDKRYVDDEFARGRKEARLVPDLLAKLPPGGSTLRETVFRQWRVVAADKRGSPRAIVSGAWEACMRASVYVFSLAKRNEADADAAVSACRHGVAAVSALPGDLGELQTELRAAAVAFGNAVAADYTRNSAIDDVEKLVKSYVERWPKLPGEPAERME